jgi:GNAT superfamily N-acetyltransferase
MDMTIRPAEYEELDRVNELRRQLHVLHANGKPEIFKPGFPDELRDYLYTIFRDPMKQILVCERGGEICAFAVLHHVTKPENPFKRELDYLDIDEFGVDEKCRRQGIAAEMIRFIRDYAKSEGFDRLELNMWEFNHDALAFYEAVGFSTYRRYMEMKL